MKNTLVDIKLNLPWQTMYTLIPLYLGKIKRNSDPREMIEMSHYCLIKDFVLSLALNDVGDFVYRKFSKYRFFLMRTTSGHFIRKIIRNRFCLEQIYRKLTGRGGGEVATDDDSKKSKDFF
jgi:hypothetical protein